MRVALNNKELVYTGRIDWENPEKPEFIFPASSLHFHFHGKKAVLALENKIACWDSYLGAIVDGTQKKWKLNPEGETEIVLLEEEEEKEHEVLIFKRQDSCHVMALCFLELSSGSHLLPSAARPERRIEVYGDSVSAGEVSEAVEYVGKETAGWLRQHIPEWNLCGIRCITTHSLERLPHGIFPGIPHIW